MANITVTPKYIKPQVGSITRTHVMTEVSQIGYSVRATGVGDKVAHADASTSPGVIGRIGMIVSGAYADPTGAIAVGEAVDVLWFGPVEMGESASLDVTKNYFVSDDAGRIADAAGTVTRRVGAPLTNTLFFWDSGMAPATS